MAKRTKATTITADAVGIIEKKSLSQQVVNRILELISTGNLRPGDRLPPERKLIEIFGISRPSLREALRALSVLGVVEPRHGGGAYVTDLEPERLLAPLDFYLSLSQSNFDDSFESRRVIEVEIVRKATQNADADDLAELAAMIDAQSAVKSDPIAFRILDSRFHEKLSEIAGNAILQRVANALYNMGLDIRRRATEARSTIAQSSKDHALIVEAISARDPDRAAEAMGCHLAHIEETTRQFAALSRHQLLIIDGSKPRRGNERSGQPDADSDAGPDTTATSAMKK